MTDSSALGATAILRIAAPDDSGARTADLFQWQAAMAAGDALAALVDQLTATQTLTGLDDDAIVCEHQEDWMIRIGDSLEIVSAKHREPQLGVWGTIAEIVTDGGVGHLFARWLELNREVSGRLVSCADLGKGELRVLAETIERLKQRAAGTALSDIETREAADCVRRFASALMMSRKGMPPAWQAEEGARAKQLNPPMELIDAATEFLTVMTFDMNRPARHVAVQACPGLYAEPVAAAFGQPTLMATVIWSAVVQLFEVRMRARGTTATGGLPELSATTQPRDLLEARTVTLSDLLLTVQTAIMNPGAYLPLIPPARLTTLSMKMAAGGCADTSIARAEQLRMDFNRYRRVREATVPGSASERDSIKRTLLRIADEETAKTRTPTRMWGSSLWEAMSDRLRDAPAEHTKVGLDGELALGGICDLSARCQVWFSSSFDVNASIAQHRALRGQS